MPDPVLVEVVRSGFVESVHHGALVITGPDGSVRTAVGDVDRPVFPRSSNKPIQALGMLRAGLELDDADLAFACASHNGEPAHVERALALLDRAGLTESDLHCPPDFPLHEASRLDVVRAGGDRRRAAMNCSGKHAAMLATCVRNGWQLESYTDPKHELQVAIADTVTELTGESIGATGVDGCGAPLFAFSLTGLARAFGKVAALRPGAAMRAWPWLVAGSGRDDTLLMLAVPGLLVKGGAEGVHAMALPDGGTVAFKIADGQSRARDPLLVAALRALDALPENPASLSVLEGLGRGAGEVRGAGREVGELRLSKEATQALAA